ncbi:MAG: glycerol-3-phosphate 1-O-acyltransferase PlsY [Novibacillus thermophilus]
MLGSIPFALIIGKAFYGVDVRKYGSGNLGATNVARVLGVKAGLSVAAGDVGKGSLAAFLPHWFGLDLDPLLVGSLAIVGHCFPLFAGFRGGKAAATTAGVLVVANLPLFLTGFLTFTLSIAVFKYVALGTMLGGLALFVYACLAGDGVYMVLTGMLFLLLIYLHRSNIRNFLNGTEMKVTDKRLRRDRLPPLKKRPPALHEPGPKRTQGG